jgi:hypothetical protein
MRLSPSHKVFSQSIHWVQKPSATFHFIASIPVFFSCSAVFETQLSIYVPLLVAFLSLSTHERSQHRFFLPLNFAPFFLTCLSFSVFSPYFLPAECTTVSLSGFLPANTFLPLPPFWHIPGLPGLDPYTHVDPRTELYRLFVSAATKSTTEMVINKGGDKARSNQRIS